MPDSGITGRERIGTLRKSYASSYRTRRRRVITAAILSIGSAVILGSAWALMLTAGIAHRDWIHQLPVLGFGTAVALVFWPWAFFIAIAFTVGVIRELAR